MWNREGSMDMAYNADKVRIRREGEDPSVRPAIVAN